MRGNKMQERVNVLKIIKTANKGSRESNLAYEKLYYLFDGAIKNVQDIFRIFFGDETEIYVLEAFYRTVNDYKEDYRFDFTSFMKFYLYHLLKNQAYKKYSRTYSRKEIDEIIELGKSNFKNDFFLLDKDFVLDSNPKEISLDTFQPILTAENEIHFVPTAEVIEKDNGRNQYKKDILEIASFLIKYLKPKERILLEGSLNGESLESVGREIDLKRGNSSFIKNRAMHGICEKMKVAQELLYISDHANEYNDFKSLIGLRNEDIALVINKTWLDYKGTLKKYGYESFLDFEQATKVLAELIRTDIMSSTSLHTNMIETSGKKLQNVIIKQLESIKALSCEKQ